MDIQSIKKKLSEYKLNNYKIFTSSSFQTHSTVLLHIISEIDSSIPIYFLQTGFHFPETIQYKEEITRRFNLNTIDLISNTPKLMQIDRQNKFLFTSDPDYCCYLNKIQPLEPILDSFDVWINGVRSDQNKNRATFQIEEKSNKKAIRFHPMLDWDLKQIYQYIHLHNIPKHPLDDKGYLSIGCEPCTRKILPEHTQDERSARWFGLHKTECGLHTELITK